MGRVVSRTPRLHPRDAGRTDVCSPAPFARIHLVEEFESEAMGSWKRH